MAVAGIHAVRAKRLVVKALQGTEFPSARRVFGISVGKAAAAMHAGLVSTIPAEKWNGGIVVTLRPEKVVGARNLLGSHPTPTEKSRRAAVEILDWIRSLHLTTDDIVFCCISGGTSAMVAAPVPGLTLANLAEVNRQLLRSGLPVSDMNAVRQALSLIHGGGLARACAPAQCRGLILCDDVRIGARMVGSGPTFAPGPPRKARAIIENHLSPPEFRDHILSCVRPLPPTPRAKNALVGGPSDALKAAVGWAGDHGYRPRIVSAALQGEARLAARRFSKPARKRKGRYCLVAAGEVTVTVKGSGVGGRCQEFAWAMARELAGMDAVFLAVGTDGCDHVPGVAGAWVDGTSMDKIESHGMDWQGVLDSNDSHTALSELGQLIHSRGTGTNVCDLYILCGRGGPGMSATRFPGDSDFS